MRTFAARAVLGFAAGIAVTAGAGAVLVLHERLMLRRAAHGTPRPWLQGLA